jgi:hypothetical protein
MTRCIVTALVAGLVLVVPACKEGAVPASKEDEARRDLEKLQGTWRGVSVKGYTSTKRFFGY